jgi:hypothetical protein
MKEVDKTGKSEEERLVLIDAARDGNVIAWKRERVPRLQNV